MRSALFAIQLTLLFLLALAMSGCDGWLRLGFPEPLGAGGSTEGATTGGLFGVTGTAPGTGNTAGVPSAGPAITGSTGTITPSPLPASRDPGPNGPNGTVGSPTVPRDGVLEDDRGDGRGGGRGSHEGTGAGTGIGTSSGTRPAPKVWKGEQRKGENGPRRRGLAADRPRHENADILEEVARLVDSERRAQGLGELRLNPKLADAAQRYSQEMANYGFVDHVGRDGRGPGDRIVAAGYRMLEAGENLAGGYGSPEQVVRAWMRSPDHRKNLLNPVFNEVGFGVTMVRGPEGLYPFWVQELASGEDD